MSNEQWTMSNEQLTKYNEQWQWKWATSNDN